MMKKLITTTVLFIIAFAAYAQSSYRIIEETLPYNHYASSFTTNLIGLNEGYVMFQWQKYIEKHGGATYVKKVDRGDFQLESEHVKFPALDNQKVTIYTHFAPNVTESGVAMTIWIKMKDDTYFSSKTNVKEMDAFKKWFLEFHKQAENNYEKAELNIGDI